MALQILLHTFRMIFGNIGQALRVSVGPYLILMAGVFAVMVIISPSIESGVGMTPIAIILGLALLPFVFFVTSWVAVSWHRFILLEEYAGLLPAVKDRPIWSYAGKAILLGLIISLIAIPVFFMLSTLALIPMAAQGGLSNGTPTIAFVVFALAMVGLSVIALRMGVALVGTALGLPMGFGEAFRATGKIGVVIFWLSLLLVLINSVPGFVISTLFFKLPIIGFVLNIALNWLTMMLGISILTTIYGHVIEDRPLVS